MPRSFADRLPLAHVPVDRDHASRADPGVFDRPAMRFLVLERGAALLDEHGGLALVERDALPPDALLVYLGVTLEPAAGAPAGTPVSAAVVDHADEPYTPGPGGRFGDLRRLVATLGPRDAALYAHALAMANWHAAHPFSPRTGEPTVPASAGWTRHGADGRELFPRTDPAVIVGVTDAADRLLLGRNAAWPADRYSLLAGFVEPGESLEAAVVREVHEEAGIRVVEPRYLGSQPWPFPASLMLGFRARVDPAAAELAPDGTEILDLRWFTRDEILAGVVALPGRASIAHAIIADWAGAEIPDGS
ncbi:NAD(+) diphosphatase [Galbitalea sp. SE-J8]|uniref:NAD(+) diphosphatase n=1 Tax=Galbitalea sp. SE-J8 TaxID=3054952 RepID=UPI00259D20CA|nr:NAD(+) diphosphatase [Galbitalea sp. SE-J8]MDM4763516.1 NAD(+) diphosphatase [Galbitalea sp. SE-J8]